MNEIKRIHLGRQPFVIAVDAHKQLRTYLEAIAAAVGVSSKEVIEEVELRMAELLQERGIDGEKVIVAEDVAYLQEQLGRPGDFQGDADADEPAAVTKAHETPEQDGGAPKRLFRDTQNGMVAGVSSGLAAFFGIDAVIVRLIFIVLTIAWGWGIALYIILWIVVPEARTSSERLHMRGKAVTVDSLKEIVDRADVQGAAQRASRYVGPAIEKIFKVFSAIVGYAVMTAATLGFFALSVVTTYMLMHGGLKVQNVLTVPAGPNETVLAVAAGTIATIILLLVFLLGRAMTNRKWALPGWATASLIGILLASAAIGTAVGPDAYTNLRDRYNATHHSVTRTVEPFKALDVRGDLTFRYVQSPEYKVDIKYFGKANPQAIVTKTAGDTLTIDVNKFKGALHCEGFCINTDEFIEATIYAPALDRARLNHDATLQEVFDGDQYWTND